MERRASTLMREDYTLEVSEFMTPAKAKAFVARYGEIVEHWVERIERKFREAHPHSNLHVRVYSAETLVRQYEQRGSNDHRIGVGHVSNIASGGNKSYSVVVEWNTEAVIIVGAGKEWVVSQSHR